MKGTSPLPVKTTGGNFPPPQKPAPPTQKPAPVPVREPEPEPEPVREPEPEPYVEETSYSEPVQENYPVEENYPEEPIQENTYSEPVEENYPPVEENYPPVEENYPPVEENYPPVEENYPEEPQTSSVLTAAALYDYNAENEGDLSFKEGDIIIIHDQSDPSGWWEGEVNGVRGFFPSNFVSV